MSTEQHPEPHEKRCPCSWRSRVGSQTAHISVDSRLGGIVMTNIRYTTSPVWLIFALVAVMGCATSQSDSASVAPVAAAAPPVAAVPPPAPKVRLTAERTWRPSVTSEPEFLKFSKKVGGERFVKALVEKQVTYQSDDASSRSCCSAEAVFRQPHKNASLSFLRRSSKYGGEAVDPVSIVLRLCANYRSV